MPKRSVQLVPLPRATALVGCSYFAAWTAIARGHVAAERRGARLFVDVAELRRAVQQGQAA